MDQSAIDEWFSSEASRRRRPTADAFRTVVADVVRKVEGVFGRELPGELVLMPSFGEFDGFARYELGEHRVMLGIDFPDADVDYLRALTAHELSHVYRDHSPAVWRHLGKPLPEVSRKEYLAAMDAREHLVSEGLATLFSQTLFPEIPASIHHFYEAAEWEWCGRNEALIEAALSDCLRGDADVWSFSGAGRASAGSPSRLQYYWAAKKLAERVAGEPDAMAAIRRLHELPAREFSVFTRPD